MAYTRHGHHIPNSLEAGAAHRPKNVARCGGVGLCVVCNSEAARWRDSNATEIKPPRQNKLPIYAIADFNGLEVRLCLGLATVKNGQYIFEKDDLHPGIMTPEGDILDAPVEATVTDIEEWKRTRRPWEENNE